MPIDLNDIDNLVEALYDEISQMELDYVRYERDGGKKPVSRDVARRGYLLVSALDIGNSNGVLTDGQKKKFIGLIRRVGLKAYSRVTGGLI